MSNSSVIVPGWRPAVRAAACLLTLAALAIVGCAEKAAEQAPVDVEQERQEHIEMMQRETGQTPAAK